jgi:hypothetical protein
LRAILGSAVIAGKEGVAMQRVRFASLALTFVLSLPFTASARPPEGTDVGSFVHRWFGSLHENGKPRSFCCTQEYDCNATVAKRNPDGSWTAFYRPHRDSADGRYIEVPSSAEVPLETTLGGMNPTGHAVLCATPGVSRDDLYPPSVRCLVPIGPGT